MVDFHFCGLRLEASPSLRLPDAFLKEGGADWTVKLTFSEAGFPAEKVFSAISHPELYVEKTPSGWRYTSPPGKPPVMLAVSEDYSALCAHLPPCGDIPGQRDRLLQLLRCAIECGFAFHSTSSLHAAAVEVDGRAVAFAGPSGMGKSTRAGAWAEALGAAWISGDRPALRLKGEGVTLCGAPWDGKEQIFRQAELPLAAILEVRRAPFTRLRRLSPAQARRLLMQQCFVPMWDTEAAAYAIANIRRLSLQAPVYRLFCGPDGNAAREAYRILFKDTKEILSEDTNMKAKSGFKLRNIVDEFVLVPTGDNIQKFDGMVILNEVSAFIWEKLQQPMGREDLIALILSEFDADRATAEADLDKLLERFREFALLEEE